MGFGVVDYACDIRMGRGGNGLRCFVLGVRRRD